MTQERKSRIIVADDNPEIVKLLETCLNGAGYEVIAAYDGEEVLRLVKKGGIDLILLDVKMPKLSGYEVCKTIKNDKKARFIPVIIVTGLDEVKDKIKGLEIGADDFLNKPVDMAELLARVRSLIRLKNFHDHLENAENVLFALAKAVEIKDAYTEEHLERIVGYSSKLVEYIGLPHEVEVAMRYAAILHDIGKIGISESILLKPGRLTKEEYDEIKKHSIIGEAIVKPLRFSHIIAPVVRGHHERWDGNGYPDGLAGEEIPLGARIVSIADAYDAMTSDRPYRSRMPEKKAINILQEGQGTQWDAKLVETFINLLQR